MCDTLHQRVQLRDGQRARCRVCSAELARSSRLNRARMIPLVLACLMLFLMANAFPIVAIELQGTVHQLTLVGAVTTLLQSGMFAVAAMVFVPTLLLPGIYLVTLLGVLWLTGSERIPGRVLNRMVRSMQQMYPWSMVEVFLLGVLVAIIKLSSMASIIAGPALWAWMGTTLTLTVVLTFRLRRLIRRTHQPVGAVHVCDGEVVYASSAGDSSGGAPDAGASGVSGAGRSGASKADRRGPVTGSWLASEPRHAPPGAALGDISGYAAGMSGHAAGRLDTDARARSGAPERVTRSAASQEGRNSQAGRSAASGRDAPVRGRQARATLPLTAAGSARFCSQRLGMMACHHCDTVWADVQEGDHCRHCGARLHLRKPGGLGVTWALLITAVILYFPANLLPVMTTSTIFGTDDSTILSGVVFFWDEGEWALAAIIFIASFLIPLFKLTALVLMALMVQFRSLWRLHERTHLYDIVEWVGRWSMLDVFVVAVTSSLIQVPGVAVIKAGPGIAAFGAVVVLTMLATMSFDPRLAWDMRFRPGLRWVRRRRRTTRMNRINRKARG